MAYIWARTKNDAIHARDLLAMQIYAQMHATGLGDFDPEKAVSLAYERADIFFRVADLPYEGRDT
jgi:hypothetical protein